MAIQATITFDVVTHESAEHGDVEESGFYAPGGWKSEDADETLTPGDVLRWATGRGCWRDNGDGSFYCEQSDTDYSDGSETSYAVHFAGLTNASLARVSRILEAS
tara:strand:- start:2546 stop:2860 length:315 start_codon:yes stop_codon:yes gene_type:complete